MMWKMLTAEIMDNIYSLISCGLIPEEQKGCCKGTRGTEEIDQLILNENKTSRGNLAMA